MTKVILYPYKVLLLAICLALSTSSFSTTTYINANISIAFFGTQAEFGDSLIIGPNANIEVLNDWLISSTFIQIAPSATISGSGRIVFSDRSTFIIGGITQVKKTVLIDGGNALIDVNQRESMPKSCILQASQKQS